MQVKTHLLAFEENKIRMVDIPDNEPPSLESVFYFGQNDFQPKQMPSLSVGDVIEMWSELYLVMPFGFKKITPSEFESYKAIPREDRSMKIYKMEEAT